METIRMRMLLPMGEEHEIPVRREGKLCAFSLPPVLERQFQLECDFPEITAVIGWTLKGKTGPDCLSYPENGFQAGNAFLSSGKHFTIRILCPENADAEHLEGRFTVTELPDGSELVTAVADRMEALEAQIEEDAEKINALTEQIKNERYDDCTRQKEAVWKAFMEERSRKQHTLTQKFASMVRKALNRP